MTLNRRVCFTVFLFLVQILILSTSMFLKGSCASENREVEFNIIDSGDISGYLGEAYFVVRTEDEWESLWEIHTAPQLHPPKIPEVDFLNNVVVCAFMGKRPTLGYSISIEKIWTDGERVHVEVIKCSPPEDFALAEVITCPYVIVSMETTDLDFVFHVIEDGKIVDYVLPEFSGTAYMLLIIFLSVALVALKFSKFVRVYE
ncbi:hypothetical protein DRO69_11865 [Candidatus Bathyarchaeota archaeon]|nr:MAG: hypothetical protein DRO69_11865 [Candidatus Bathyarchaeota archaeon]